jgi:hypothetical protein
MSLELWNTIATSGTFVVIAATAIAALIQLRHARSGNQIAILNEMYETFQKPEFGDALHFVSSEMNTKLEEPEFCYQLANPSARAAENQALFRKISAVCIYFENLGTAVKIGMIDRDLALNNWSTLAIQAWANLEPVIAIYRRSLGDSVWENFEYLVVLAQDWQTAHPQGSYPSGVRRIALKDVWLERDARYKATRANAGA